MDFDGMLAMLRLRYWTVKVSNRALWGRHGTERSSVGSTSVNDALVGQILTRLLAARYIACVSNSQGAAFFFNETIDKHSEMIT
jgi:hypothetical protein